MTVLGIDVSAALAAELQGIVPLPSPAERRSIRQAAGLTQLAMARVTGATKQAISQWEAGTREPRGQFRARYAAALALLRVGKDASCRWALDTTPGESSPKVSVHDEAGSAEEPATVPPPALSRSAEDDCTPPLPAVR